MSVNLELIGSSDYFSISSLKIDLLTGSGLAKSLSSCLRVLDFPKEGLESVQLSISMLTSEFSDDYLYLLREEV